MQTETEQSLQDTQQIEAMTGDEHAGRMSERVQETCPALPTRPQTAGRFVGTLHRRG